MGAVWGLGFLVSVESFQEIGEVVGGELPLEGFGGRVVADLEAGEALLNDVEVGEVVGGQRFSLDDREVDLDLVEPGRVDRGVHQNRVGELFGEPVDGLLSRWDEPLSTTQNTRSADAYGSWVMTWATSAVNGSMPVVASHRP